MSRRSKIIIAVIAIVVVLLIVAGLIWWLIMRPQLDREAVNANQGLQIPAGLPNTPPGSVNTPEALLGEPELEAGLKAIALTFAERFGSYSNQGNFSNLDDLIDLMTVRMKAWSDNYIATNKLLPGDDPDYYGVTTKALSVQILNFDKSLGRSEVTVSTQRQEARGNTINPRIFYQDLNLDLVDSGDGWKVDRAEWQ